MTIAKAIIVALIAVFGLSACNVAVYENLPDSTQRDIVVAKTVEAWKNKGNQALFQQLANDLAALSPSEAAQAAQWASDTWKWLDAVEANRRAVAAAAPSGDCYAAARKHFPQSEWNKAYQIINRESGGNPAAKNTRSTASGCFQILRGSWRHPGGVSFDAGRFNADHNAAAARAMWNGNGWHCTCTWALTA